MRHREPLFSKKNLKLLSDPINNSNPITVQVLGDLLSFGSDSTIEAMP